MHKVVMWIVWAVHGGFALALFLQPHFAPTKKEHKTLLVKTITPKPIPSVTARSVAKMTAPVSHSKQKPVATPQSSKAPAATSQPKKETPKATAPTKKPATTTPPNKSKNTEPAIADKQICKDKKTSPPKTIPQPRAKISDSLLQELEESIAKIEQKADTKGKPEKRQHISPLALQIDTASLDQTNSEEGSYIEMLVGHLHQALQLPEYGEVKIQLSLRQDGSVVKIAVLQAQSKKNKRYLEENLPHLRFPRLEGSLASQKEASFILTFVNEM